MALQERVPQKYEFLVALDFEATCEENFKIKPQEIIEFPCIKFCAKSFEEVSRFHSYVKPVHHPKLSDFCVRLTHITDCQLQDKPNFEEVFKNVNEWMKKENINESNSIFITFGDWDLKTMLRDQCATSKLEVPKVFDHWINIRKTYNILMKAFPQGIDEMLEGLGEKFDGHLHSGIDDSYNIGRIIQKLNEKFPNYVFSANGRVISQEEVNRRRAAEYSNQ